MTNRLLNKINEMDIFTGINLNNCLVIACQHILETNIPLFESLIKKGLLPENTFLLGKVYSTNSKIFDELKKIGMYVDKGSVSFDSHKS